MHVLLTDFDYQLPQDLIAQEPASRRDDSRLMVLSRDERNWRHRNFKDVSEELRSGDLLVLNNSKVIPARLSGLKETGARMEILLIEESSPTEWWCLLKPGKRANPGARLQIANKAGSASGLMAETVMKNEAGHYLLRFEGAENLLESLQDLGQPPLPPYIRRDFNDISEEDRNRYQTVYASEPGSVAAPTAGLHFTKELLDRLTSRGIRTTEVTLHVGLGTFLPVKADRITEHRMHSERFSISDTTAKAINLAKSEGRRVIAVGTTTVRVLESLSDMGESPLRAASGRTEIFIYPPRQFNVVDALITNFHLPKSTLLMLISAFASPGELDGREFVLSAYEEAVRERYRFFSYGDAMLIQ